VPRRILELDDERDRARPGGEECREPRVRDRGVATDPRAVAADLGRDPEQDGAESLAECW
jgi:hypothetical protein